ncbi:hypothetical protein QNK12_15160 [Neobacillus cucumis]|nr:hypothetical protein QNK12_15160 [Neobacillus cucumis]
MLQINSNEILNWESKKTGTLFISEQMYHRHSELFLGNYSQTKKDIESSLNQELKNLDFKVSSKKKNNETIYLKRIGAESLKKSIKHNLRNINDIKFEVEYRDGVFYELPRKGFDFAVYDDDYNLLNFWNYCFGERSISNGEELWKKELDLRPNWKSIAKELNLNIPTHMGINIPVEKKKPTIIGGIQFGNWGLFHSDMLNAIHIEQQTEVDLLIYITATGNLEKQLSDSIVNFKNSKQQLIKFHNIIKIPIWLIGVDIK